MVRNRDLEELMPRAGTFADNTKDLVAKLKVLTVAEQQQEDARLEAKAELDAADAQLEQDLLGKVSELKDKIAEGRNYLEELLGGDDDKAEEVEKKTGRVVPTTCLIPG